MANSWNVLFKLDRQLVNLEKDAIESRIPRSAVWEDENLTVVSVRQAAPSSMDAINRVGSQLRNTLGRSKLGVIDVKASAVSEEQAFDDKLDDLVRRFISDSA